MPCPLQQTPRAEDAIMAGKPDLTGGPAAFILSGLSMAQMVSWKSQGMISLGACSLQVIVVDVEDRDDSVWHNLTPLDGGLSGWRLLWDRWCPIPSLRCFLPIRQSPFLQQVCRTSGVGMSQALLKGERVKGSLKGSSLQTMLCMPTWHRSSHLFATDCCCRSCSRSGECSDTFRASLR